MTAGGFKIVHLSRPKVESVHPTQEQAMHALAIKQMRHNKKHAGELDFEYGVVPASLTFRHHKCHGWCWS